MNLLKPSTWGKMGSKQQEELLKLMDDFFKAKLEAQDKSNAKLFSDLGDRLDLKITGLFAVLGKKLEAQAYNKTQATEPYDVQIDEQGRVAKLVTHGESCEVPKGWRVKVRHLTQEEVAKIKKDLDLG